jgi:hypothetical protein
MSPAARKAPRYVPSPAEPNPSKKTPGPFSRSNRIRYRPTASAPMISATKPAVAARERFLVPLKLTAAAIAMITSAVPIVKLTPPSTSSSVAAKAPAPYATDATVISNAHA